MRMDFSPLYRSTVGFDRLFSLMDGLGAGETAQPAYPPYTIERTGENAYRITMAVAGFTRGELDLTVQENTLIVSGKAVEEAQPAERSFLHRGIAKRAFERRFQLADTIKVTGASYENGLLNIDLVREVPEAMKPHKIAIGGAQPVIEDKKAA